VEVTTRYQGGMIRLAGTFLVLGTLSSYLHAQNEAEALDSVRYDQVSSKACHNCYEKGRSPSFRQVLDHVKTVEIDFFDSYSLLGGADKGKWFVRHSPLSFGNDNCCSGDQSESNDFAACLHDVAVWSDLHPNHNVITVFLDKKQDWQETRSPRDLDRLIKALISREKIFAPRDLKGPYHSLRDAVNKSHWPTIRDLRGKIVLVLTDGRIFGRGHVLAEYIDSREDSALVFVAPEVSSEKEILLGTSEFGKALLSSTVFFNLDADNYKLAATIHSLGCISRVWSVKENEETFLNLTSSYVNFIAVDEYRSNLPRSVILR